MIRAPFPYFGGKSSIIDIVWQRLGRPKQYIEPFCGSAAILLGAAAPASLEVVNDINGFIANFWRATKYQPGDVARWADYPVSHIDIGARHRWLMEQRARIGDALLEPEWPGDAKIAGWWLWGQCCWIGSGWCEWLGKIPHVSDAGRGIQAIGKIPYVSSAGMGIHAIGQIPHVGDAGMGIHAIGKIPHVSDAGRGIQAIGKIPHVSGPSMGAMLTSAGRVAWYQLHRIADRLERVRILHGDWQRCLNSHYGATNTAVFFDPPYAGNEEIYRTDPVAPIVESWAKENACMRIALCGLVGDYDLPGWEIVRWSRDRHTYGSNKTTRMEAIWFSPACAPPMQGDLFSIVRECNAQDD